MSFEWNSDDEDYDENGEFIMPTNWPTSTTNRTRHVDDQDSSPNPMDITTTDGPTPVQWMGGNDQDDEEESESDNNLVDWEDADSNDPAMGDDATATQAKPSTTATATAATGGKEPPEHLPHLREVTINLNEPETKESQKQRRKRPRRRNTWKLAQLPRELQSTLLQLQRAHILAWVSHVTYLSSQLIPQVLLARAISCIPTTFWKDNDNTTTAPTYLLVQDFCTWYSQQIVMMHQQRRRRGRGQRQRRQQRKASSRRTTNGESSPEQNQPSPSSSSLQKACIHWVEELLHSISVAENDVSTQQHGYGYRTPWDCLFSNLLCCALMRHTMGWRVRWCMALDDVVGLDLDIHHPWLLCSTRNVIWTANAATRLSTAVAKSPTTQSGGQVPPAATTDTTKSWRKRKRHKTNPPMSDGSNNDNHQDLATSTTSPFVWGWMEVLCTVDDKKGNIKDKRQNTQRRHWIHVDVSNEDFQTIQHQNLFLINQPQTVESKLANLKVQSTLCLSGDTPDSTEHQNPASLQPFSTFRKQRRRKQSSLRARGRNGLPSVTSVVAFVLGIEHDRDPSGSRCRCTDVTPRYAASRIATLQQRGLSRIDIQDELAGIVSQQSQWWTKTLQCINHYPENGESIRFSNTRWRPFLSSKGEGGHLVDDANKVNYYNGQDDERKPPAQIRHRDEGGEIHAAYSDSNCLEMGCGQDPCRTEGVGVLESSDVPKLPAKMVQNSDGNDSGHGCSMDMYNNDDDEEVLEAEEDLSFSIEAENEPMPTSKSGFANHPLYILKSQLGKTHVLSPTASVCGLFAGESVYLRRDVTSAMEPRAWLYRCRKVKQAEENHPVIRLPPRRKAASKKGFQPLATYGVGVGNDGSDQQRFSEIARASLKEDCDKESQDRLLYAKWQTVPWAPTPVGPEDPIPLNEYKNVELGLINPGLKHVDIPGAAVQAAKVLGVPYAPCLIGFGNNGQGTPVVRGIVVHAHNADMIEQAAAQIIQHKSEQEQDERRRIVHKRWKKLMLGVLVKKRLDREYGTTEENGDEEDDTVVHLD